MQLYKHQQQFVERSPNRHALWFETGVGKTVAVLAKLERIQRSFLVVCPKSLVQQWEEQIAKWLPGYKHAYRVLSKENFRSTWEKVPGYECLILDECHFYKNPTSQMTKNALKWLSRHQPWHIYLLSATPYTSPWSVFSYEKLLGKNPSYVAYRYGYFNDVRMGVRTVPVVKSGIEDEMKEKLEAIGTFVKLADCVDMPEAVYETEYFDLTPQQKKFITTVWETEPVHIARWTAIHQIMGGTYKGLRIPSEKERRLKEYVEEHKKLIVVCRYVDELTHLQHICKEKNKPCVIISGDTKNRHEAVQAAERADEMIVGISAGCSEGYELPSFPVMVMYSYDFSLSKLIQVQGRNRRINRPTACTYISLVVRGTIDEDVHNLMMKKQDFHLHLYNAERPYTKYKQTK